MTSKGKPQMFRLKSPVLGTVTVRHPGVEAGQTYTEALLRGDAVSSGNVLRGATEAALRRYREETAMIAKKRT